MKVFITLALLFIANSIFALEPNYSDVTSAIQKNDIAQLQNHLADNVDITLPSNEGVYSKSQAMHVLKNFFSKHQAKSCSIMHTGNSGDSYYLLADLTAGGESYGVFIYHKASNGSHVIQKITIEED
ncbi:MAG: hypothetical protein ACI837_003294 [Crocinitomicaceae bacterium]|jgi:hypothetical protein